MICHNNGHPKALSIGNLLRCCNSIVTGYDRVCPGFFCPVNEILIDPVTIRHAVRNINVYYCPKSPQAFHQYISRIYSINIIIPDDTDSGSLPDLFQKNLYRFVHIFHQHPIIQIGNRSIEIILYCLISDNSPISYKYCQIGTDMEFSADTFKICSLSK